MANIIKLINKLLGEVNEELAHKKWYEEQEGKNG